MNTITCLWVQCALNFGLMLQCSILSKINLQNNPAPICTSFLVCRGSGLAAFKWTCHKNCGILSSIFWKQTLAVIVSSVFSVPCHWVTWPVCSSSSSYGANSHSFRKQLSHVWRTHCKFDTSQQNSPISTVPITCSKAWNNWSTFSWWIHKHVLFWIAPKSFTSAGLRAQNVESHIVS